eukprot:1145059-Pelagomonas_calceolata.AAC.4
MVDGTAALKPSILLQLPTSSQPDPLSLLQTRWMAQQPFAAAMPHVPFLPTWPSVPGATH